MLRWIGGALRRARGEAVESPIGLLPATGALDTTGLDVDARDDARAAGGRSATTGSRRPTALGEFFAKFGDRLPAEIERQRQALVSRLG